MSLVEAEERLAKRRPKIIVNDWPLRYQSDDALKALQEANDPPELFERSAALVRLRIDERGRPFIERVREAELRGRLVRVADAVRSSKQGKADVHVSPPDVLVRDLLQRGDWKFPALEAIVEAPTLRPDGTILSAPGYDRTTRLLYVPPPGFELPPIPGEPTAEQLAAAVGLVREAVCDFPFDGDASRANAIGLLLTPILRPAIDGQVPLALIDSTKAGTGKGLLAGAVALVATGRLPAMLTAPAREEEWRKVMLATLAAGSPLVVLDNIEEPLRSPAFASALTSGRVVDRMLGVSEMLSVPNLATWAATGNNLKVGGDLARRCYQIRLDAKNARPWQRDGFKHDPLPEWIAEQRAELLAAVLTMGRAWFAAGCPAADVATIGGFESWTRVIGGVLAHAGIGGFVSDQERFYEQADEDAAEWERFLRAWREHWGSEPVTARAVERELRESLDTTLHDALPGDLADALHGRGSFARTLGKALSRREGTRFGDDELHVVRAGSDARGGQVLWQVCTRAGLQVSQVSTHRYAGASSSSNGASAAHKPVKPGNLRDRESV